MPFKETEEGQTHSYNDGCGEPEHNMPTTTDKKEECKICKPVNHEYSCRCSCHSETFTLDTFIQKTLAEFDEKFSASFVEYEDKQNVIKKSIFPVNLQELKDFLSSALNAQRGVARQEEREEIREKVEGMKVAIPEGKKVDIFVSDEERKIWNIALDNIVTLLSPNNKDL